MKVLTLTLFSFILSSCVFTTHTHRKIYAEIDNLKDMQRMHWFMIEHDKCFIKHNSCVIRGAKRTACWKAHEKCVINVNKMYQKVKEQN
jgi:hypothetical protein